MSAIPGLEASMLTFSARLATFTTEHQLSKRRASSQKKKAAATVSWPHESPSAEELARAGFFYKPAPDSNDNAQCFHCAVKLDGWESHDVPLQEHLAHSSNCAYALSLSVFDKSEERDPMSPELVEARTNTFADMWPHEQKKGWKPKVKQMVEAGWAYDPSPQDEDGATCFYCNMSLDGWEPKDSPLEEHRRREPNCLFFALMDRYKSTRRKGGRGRASTASKASRLSTQSMKSTFSEAPSLMSLGDAGQDVTVEESLAIDTTITSDAGKGRKKTTKGKKKTARQESVEPPAEYPTLQDDSLSAPVDDTTGAFPVEEEQPKSKRGRKPKTVQDSTVIDDSTIAEPAKKTRGRKKAKEPSPPARVSQDESQLQSELQEAAEFASTIHSPSEKPARGVKRTSDGLEKTSTVEDVTVEEAPAKPKKAAKGAKGKKGKKAAKDAPEEADESVDLVVSQPEVKPKRGRSKKAPKVEPESEPEPEVEAEPQVEPEVEPQETEETEPELQQEPEPEPEAEAEVEAEPEVEPEPEPELEVAEELDQVVEYDQSEEPGPEPEEDSEAEIEQEQDENAEPEVEPEAEEDADMEAEEEEVQDASLHPDADVQDDELEVEAEVEDGIEEEVEKEQLEEEPASVAPTPRPEEFEPTPTPQVKRVSAAPRSSVRRSTRRQSPESAANSIQSTPKSPLSEQSSDAENHPPSSSNHAPTTAKKNVTSAPTSDIENPALKPKEVFASPTKTVRIPLAASTPNRSPSRQSPSKFNRLTSSVPWEPVDLDTIFLPSSENENGGDADDIFNKMLEAGGTLTSPEKKMTVEEWIRWRAELCETKLKKECERMVMLFEKEGNRGLEALNGIQTLS